MARRWKRILSYSVAISILVALSFGSWAAFTLYYSFGNSHVLFRLRHHCLPQLDFYTNAYTYAPAQPITVFASGNGRARVLLYDIFRQDTVADTTFSLCFQPVREHPSVTGAGWAASCVLRPHAPSGWYVLELADGTRTRRQSVFLAPNNPSPAGVAAAAPAAAPRKRIAMLLCTNTWNAYNAWGGQSLYTPNYTPTVSFLRPQWLSDPWLPDLLTHQQYQYQSAAKDRYLAELLHTHRLEVDVYDMGELERADNRLKQYELITLSTHSEYWTRNMLVHLNAYLAQGGSLLSLSGNTAAYVSSLDLAQQTLSVHKSEANLWMIEDSAGGLRPFGTGTSFFGFHSYAPYRVLVDSSWVFAGTALQKGDFFGKKSDCYDYTYSGAPLSSIVRGLMRRGSMGCASGMEVDKVYRGTPANFVLLATGLNPPKGDNFGLRWPEDPAEWQGGGGADMGYYCHKGGGIVFCASSIACSGALPYDTALQRIVLNVANKVLQKQKRPFP